MEDEAHGGDAAGGPIATCAFVQFDEIFEFKAHTIHILAMCDAMSSVGVDTTLYMYPPSHADVPDPAELRASYGLENVPKISWVPRDRSKWRSRLRVMTESSRASHGREYAYTTRGLAALGALAGGARHVLLEIHQPVPARHDRLAIELGRRSSRLHVICISKRLAETIAAQCGIDESSIIVEHSGHSFPIRYDYGPHSADGRRVRALYAGTFLPGKGVETIFELARRHPGIDFVVVGGEATAGQLSDNVTVQAPVPHAEIPGLLSQADILLMPLTTNTRRDSPGTPDAGAQEEFYSPLKMIEYLSAGRSIVASNLPSIAEVLVNGSNSLLVDADSVDEWSEALSQLAFDPELRARLSAGAAETAEHHTNVGRVRRILERVKEGS